MWDYQGSCGRPHRAPDLDLELCAGRGGLKEMHTSFFHRASLCSKLLALVPSAALSLVIGLSGLSACNNSGGSLMDEPGSTLLPGVKINLPAPPSFAEPNIPREYPDGSVSIYGMRKEFHRYSDKKNKYLGEKVKVKAYLLEIYKCPECPKKQTCKPCDAPHMFAVDEAGAPKEKSILIAEYRAFKGKEPKLTIGKQYIFEGTFGQSSPAGFSASDGVLVFNKMLDDTNKEFIGPAEEMERQAALAEAALQKSLKAKSGTP